MTLTPTTTRTATTLLACTLALAGCDKRPPESESGQKAGAEEKPDTSDEEATAEAAQSAGEEPAANRAGNWKAHDAHTHIGPNAYPIVEKVLEDEEIFRIVNLSGGHRPEAHEAHLKRSKGLEGRVAQFFNMSWKTIDDEDFGQTMADRLEAAVERGYAGLKISKALGLSVKTEDGDYLPVDTPKMDPVWERAGQLGVPVLIHTGDPKAFFEEPNPENERWEELKTAPDWSFHGEEYPSRKSLLEARDRVLEKHPDTTFILAHLGNNPEDLDYVANVLEEYPNAYLDTSARVAEFGRHDAERVREFFRRFQDRILFGTDIGIHAKQTRKGLYYSLFLGSVRKERPNLDDVGPFFDKHWRYFETDKKAVAHPIPIQGDWKVHPINLPADVKAKVYWKNAERIVFAPWLGRTAARDVAARATQLIERQ